MNAEKLKQLEAQVRIGGKVNFENNFIQAKFFLRIQTISLQ